MVSNLEIKNLIMNKIIIKYLKKLTVLIVILLVIISLFKHPVLTIIVLLIIFSLTYLVSLYVDEIMDFFDDLFER